VCFIDDDEIPGRGDDVIGLVSSEVVGADDEVGLVGLERIAGARLGCLFVGTGFENGGGEEEFFCQFLVPLLAKVRGRDDEDTAFALGPALGEEDTGFDGLAETDLVGEEGTV